MLILTHIITEMTSFLTNFSLPITNSIIKSKYQKIKASNEFFRSFYTYKQTILVLKDSLRKEYIILENSLSNFLSFT